MLVVTDRLQQYNASVGMIIWSSTFESTVDCSNSVSSFPWLLVSRYDSRSAVMEGRWGWVAWQSEEKYVGAVSPPPSDTPKGGTGLLGGGGVGGLDSNWQHPQGSATHTDLKYEHSPSLHPALQHYL